MDKIDAGASDKLVLEILGRRARQERINQNITQKDLALRAGVGRIVVQRLEGGKGCALGAFVRILRALGRLTQIDLFLPEPGMSPLLLARSRKGERMRARTRSSRPSNQTE